MEKTERLTNEQRAAIEKIKSAFKEAKDLNVRFVFDTYNYELTAFNGKAVDSVVTEEYVCVGDTYIPVSELGKAEKESMTFESEDLYCYDSVEEDVAIIFEKPLTDLTMATNKYYAVIDTMTGYEQTKPYKTKKGAENACRLLNSILPQTLKVEQRTFNPIV